MEWMKIPQINANEDEVEVVEVRVEEGQEVRRGEVVLVLESTKATVEVEARRAGFVRQVGVSAGDRVAVGTPWCAITDEATTPIEEGAKPAPIKEAGERRLTQRARALVEEYDLAIDELDGEGIVTEEQVLALLRGRGEARRAPGDRVGPSARRQGYNGARRGRGIVIFGAGGHARVIIDLIRQGRPDLDVVGLVDDAPDAPEQVLGVPVLGDRETLVEMHHQGVALAALGVGAVPHTGLRADLYEQLAEIGFEMPALIHPDASVAPSATIGRGAQIFAGAVVSANAQVGRNAIINSGAVISHDCRVGDHAHITPGALLAGAVEVGERSVIGMGATIYLGVRVGAAVVVANGETILSDVGDDEVVRHR